MSHRGFAMLLLASIGLLFVLTLNGCPEFPTGNEGEGTAEGIVEGEPGPEGLIEGEGASEGILEGEIVSEGLTEGEGSMEGQQEDLLALNTAVSGNGSVALDPPGGGYAPGTLVAVTAEPATGWHFDHWEGDTSGSGTAVFLTVEASISVTAVFVQDEYDLQIEPQGNGSVTLDPPGGTYLSGTVVTLTPVPDVDYRFEVWGGSLFGTQTPITITMDEDKYVQPFFMPDRIPSYSPNSLCAVGDTLYFLGNGPHTGQELWKTDGTFEGTRLVKDLNPGSSSSETRFLIDFNGTLFFLTYSQFHYALWKSDGTETGTVEVASLGSSFPAMRPCVVGDRLFISASGSTNGELWVSDGTADGTRLLRSFGPSTGVGYANPARLTNAGGVFYFSTSPADDGVDTLWKSDGTEAGTVSVYSSQYIDEIAYANGAVFFYGGTDTENHLFMTDGTSEGTQALSSFDFGPGLLTPSGNLLYFAAEPSYFSNSLVWATDGVSVNRVDMSGYRPWGLTDVNGTLFYIALYDVESQAHCGIFAATGGSGSLLKDINAHLFYGYNDCAVNVNGTLYFTAENSVQGVGIWKSDGTPDGTVMVSDINLVPVGVVPTELTAFNDRLFFLAADETNGTQVWSSDGTLAGTGPISCPTP